VRDHGFGDGRIALVQTESSARGTVIDEKEIDSLPLPTRNSAIVIYDNWNLGLSPELL